MRKKRVEKTSRKDCQRCGGVFDGKRNAKYCAVCKPLIRKENAARFWAAHPDAWREYEKRKPRRTQSKFLKQYNMTEEALEKRRRYAFVMYHTKWKFDPRYVARNRARASKHYKKYGHKKG